MQKWVTCTSDLTEEMIQCLLLLWNMPVVAHTLLTWVTATIATGSKTSKLCQQNHWLAMMISCATMMCPLQNQQFIIVLRFFSVSIFLFFPVPFSWHVEMSLHGCERCSFHSPPKKAIDILPKGLPPALKVNPFIYLPLYVNMYFYYQDKISDQVLILRTTLLPTYILNT